MCKKMHTYNYSPKSNNLYLSALKGVLRETLGENLISEAHLSRVRSSVPTTESQLLSVASVDAEIESMLSNCDNDFRYQGIRDAAIISLAFDCAMSPGDIAALEVTDIDLADGTICFQRKKEVLTIKLSEPTIARLHKWLSLRTAEIGEDGILFTRIRKGNKSTLMMPCFGESEPISSGNIQLSGLTQVAIREAIRNRSVNCEILTDAASVRNASKRRRKKDYSPDELRDAILQCDF